MNRAGKIFVQNIYAGIIRETDSGYEFGYDVDYLDNERIIRIGSDFYW